MLPSAVTDFHEARDAFRAVRRGLDLKHCPTTGAYLAVNGAKVTLAKFTSPADALAWLVARASRAARGRAALRVR